jgi:hypothetical protein
LFECFFLAPVVAPVAGLEFECDLGVDRLPATDCPFDGEACVEAFADGACGAFSPCDEVAV